MKKHGIEIATTDVLGNKIEPKLLVGDFNGYGSGEIFDANAVHLLVLQQIADLVNLAPEALDTLGEIADVLNLKEDAIADLEEIRSGAALGATSYQKPLSGIPYSDMAEAVLLLLDKAGTALQSHQDISHKVDRNELEEVAFTGSYQSLSNKPFIPTLVSQLANDAGYLTLHQDISMKADRSELFSREYDDLLNKPVIPVVPENVGDFVNNVGYLTQHQDISGKQDVIADLETIRAGAALGATSIQQHLSLANYYTKGEVDTILTTIEGEIPTKLSLLQNDPGYLTAHLSLADYLRIADLPLNLSSYNNDVPFLTQHLDISGKADKSTTVTNVAYDTTNKKFTKTINGSTTDIVNASTVVSGGITVVNNTPTLDWNTTSTIGSVQGTELKVKLPANPNTDTNTAALKVSDTTNKKINTVESPNSYILFEGGTNEFTVKDGVNSFKVSVTPSITNNVTGSSLTANNIILGNGNSTVKDSGKAIESGSNTTLSANDAKIPTSLVVKNYIDTSLTSVLRYKGTIGSSGATVTALPATHYVGWVYVVATAGTYAGKACEVGDYVICRIDGTTANDAHWDVVNGENLVSSANNTAAWGSAVIVGNVDGTDLKFTMPANPNTWRGILNNLTSTSTSDSLSAYQGYLLANGSARDNTKLPLAGGIMTGCISKAGTSVAWYQGRDTSLIKTTSYSGYNALVSMKTTDGSWELGVHSSNTAYMTYITDANYNASTNTQTYQLTFPKATGTLALTSQIPTTLPASDVYAWAKAATKPSYTLDEVSDGSTRKWSLLLRDPWNVSNGIIDDSMTFRVFNTGSEVGIGLRKKDNGKLIFVGRYNDKGYIYLSSAGTTKYFYFNDTGTISSDGFIKNGGTSSQFLKADGSVDSNTYIHTGNLIDSIGTSYVKTYLGVNVDPSTTYGYYAIMTTKSGITTDWWHILHMDWSNSNDWRSELALPTQSREGVYYRTDGAANWTWKSWIKLLDANNYSSYALPLSGGTLTGNAIIKSSTNTPGFSVKTSANTNIAYIGSGASSPGSGSEHGILQLYHNGSDAIRLYASPNQNSWINNGGNFGIGDSTPSVRLYVKENRNSVWTSIFSAAYSSSHSSMYIAHSGGYGVWIGASTTDSGHYLMDVRNGTTGAGSGGSSVLYVRADAKVGICTGSPSYSLHVNGTFYASGNSSIGGVLTVKGGYVGINNSNPEVELDVNGDMFIGDYGYINRLAVGFKSHTKQEAIDAKDGNIHMFTVSSWSGNLTVNNQMEGLIITVIFKNTNATTGFGVHLGNFAKSEVVSVTANGGVSVIQLVCAGSNQSNIYPASVKQYS